MVLPFKQTLLFWSCFTFAHAMVFFFLPATGLGLWCGSDVAVNAERTSWVQMIGVFFFHLSALYCCVAHATDPAHRRMILCSILTVIPVNSYALVFHVFTAFPEVWKNCLIPAMACQGIWFLSMLLCFPDARNAVTKAAAGKKKK